MNRLVSSTKTKAGIKPTGVVSGVKCTKIFLQFSLNINNKDPSIGTRDRDNTIIKFLVKVKIKGNKPIKFIKKINKK